MIGATGLHEATRQLRRSPGFSALVVLVIALAVGATTAVFSLVNAVLLRPLPYPDPATLWAPHLVNEGGGFRSPWAPFSHPKYRTFLEAQQVFAQVGAYTDENFNLTAGETPERIASEMVTPDYFSVLGARPLVGRLFAAGDEDVAGGARSVLLAEGLWRRRFGGDPEVVGKTLEIERHTFTVIGVLPESFVALSGPTDLWLPLATLPVMWDWAEALDEAGSHFLRAVARSRRGLAPEVVRAGSAAAGTAVAEAHPTPAEFADGSKWSGGAQTLAEFRRDANLRRSLVVLLAAVAGVLLVACANVAGLLLARSVSRRRELAVRASLGAGRSRLAGQLLGESLVLAGLGGVGGVVLAPMLVRGLFAVAPQALSSWGVSGSDLQNLTAARVDAAVLLFAMAVVTLAAMLAGLAPALVASRADPAEALREGGASLAGAGGHRRHRTRRALVVIQSAAAVVLLVGAGLLLRSLDRLWRVDPGFRPQGTVSLHLVPSQGEFDRTSAPLLHERTLERIAALPGVASVSLGNCLPVSDACNSTIVRAIDGVELPRAEAPLVGAHNVGPGYFRTLGVRLVAGREFAASDRVGAPRVAIVDEATARRLWPDESALGRQISIGMGMQQGEFAEVVGVVSDVRYGTLESAPTEDVYLPDFQTGWSSTRLFVRAEGDPLSLVPALREALRDVAPSVPIASVRTLDEQLARASSRTRFAALLLGVFAALALLLAALGVYGVVAQSVADRRRELGLRMALGAEARRIARMVVQQGVSLVALGVALGAAAAWAAARALEGLLYGVSPRDPWTYAAVPLVVLAAAGVACWLPAWRAARLDPATVLRAE
jgi:putative ABC transport system permease protein